MDERQKIDLVKRTWFAVVAQNLDLALPHVADDLEWTLYAKFPGAKPVGRGKAAVREVARQMRQSLPSGVEIIMRREHCAGETVILEYSVRAAAFNGRSYDNNCCLLFDLRGDQICAIREYLDSLTTYNTFFAEISSGSTGVRNREKQTMTTQSAKTVQETARFLEQAAHDTPEAFDAAVDAIWADEGAVVGHTPPLPSDGIMQREFVTEAHRRVAEAMRRAMPDFHYENISAKVAGEVIDFSYDQAGTTTDGRRLSATVGVRFTIRDGQVKEAVSAYDHEQMAPFMALMADLTPAA